MSRMFAVSLWSLSTLGACAAGSSELARSDEGIEVRPFSTDPVSGTAFTCTGHDARIATPCDTFAVARQGTGVALGDDGLVLLLSRASNAADGGAVIAKIALGFGPADQLVASGSQITERQRAGTSFEQPAVDGWIEPVAAAPTPEGRNAGRFSLTFDWGTISGTYDTDARP